MRRFRINLSNRCYHLISRVAHHAYFFDEDERTRFVDFGRRLAEFAAAEILIDEGWQAANRKGRAAMTRKTYCGNLLWQSGLTLLVSGTFTGPQPFAGIQPNGRKFSTTVMNFYKFDDDGLIIDDIAAVGIAGILQGIRVAP